jgi:cyclopropane fatty-acyl-phospholipid synthase-like methyltransferase
MSRITILRLHFAETLKAWRQRFLVHREEVGRISDQRFVRMRERISPPRKWPSASKL